MGGNSKLNQVMHTWTVWFRLVMESGPVALLTICVLFLSACSTPPKSSDEPEPGAIVKLNLIAVPVGLNLDNRPGPDGFSVKVYANDTLHAKGIPIRDGLLEILAFDGSFFGRTNMPPTLRTWKFPATDLAPYRFKSTIGIGYEFTLLWGTNKPSRTLISVAARYFAPNGRVVTARASSVSVLDK